MKVRRAILAEIVAVTQRTKGVDVAAVALAFAKRLSHDDWKPAFAVLGWEPPKKASGCFDYRGIALKRVAAASSPEIARFLIVATLVSTLTISTYQGPELTREDRKALLAAAEHAAVDAPAIERKIRAEAAEKENAKAKGKPAKSKKPAKKAEKKRSDGGRA
jgi:hypothetical protein